MEKFKDLLAGCMDSYGAEDNADDDSDEDEEEAEWPYNAISKKAIFNFDDGYFGENKTPISKEEIELCRELSKKASEVFGDGEIGLGSEGGEPFVPFWLVATKEGIKDAAPPTKITAELIRERFEGTIFPPAIISIYPLIENENKFLDDIKTVYEDPDGELDIPWYRTIEWFKDQKEDFIDTAMIYIGDDFPEMNEEDFPYGTETPPCCLPRMMLGLTKNGSLTGLFGYVVST